MKSYTVAFLCPSFAWGGLEMNVYRLSLRLKKRGHKLILFACENSPLWQAAQKDEIILIPFNSQSKLKDILLIPHFLKTLKKHNCQTVVLHMNQPFIAASLAKTISKNSFKFIYTQHMHVGVSKKDWFHTWIYSKLDSWLATSPSMVAEVKEKTAVEHNKIKIIPRGVDSKTYIDNLPSKSEARQKLKLPMDEIIVGVVGRIDPQKGQHLLIEAAARVHRQGFPIHVMIAGDKSLNEEFGYEKQLHDTTERLNLQEYIHYLPYQNEPQYAMAALDIFTLTTNSETYGMVTIEAMMSGLIVIGSNRGGTLDLIDDNIDGLLFETMNSDSLADKILFCLQYKDKAAQFGIKARNKMRDKYSSERECELWENLFDEI